MKTFKEYVKENYNEDLDESFLRKAGAAAILAGALTSGYKGLSHSFSPTAPSATSSWGEDDVEYNQEKDERDLLSAAKRAGVPQSQWRNLKGEKSGGVIVVVNGRKVPLTKAEQQKVKAADFARRLNNN